MAVGLKNVPSSGFLLRGNPNQNLHVGQTKWLYMDVQAIVILEWVSVKAPIFSLPHSRCPRREMGVFRALTMHTHSKHCTHMTHLILTRTRPDRYYHYHLLHFACKEAEGVKISVLAHGYSASKQQSWDLNLGHVCARFTGGYPVKNAALHHFLPTYSPPLFMEMKWCQALNASKILKHKRKRTKPAIWLKRCITQH